MGKITSYARQQTHGVSDALSGATVAPSNDHTDGSWAITDIYDRELMINTGNGNLQYRAGSDIYTVNSAPTSGATKTVIAPIGTWNMNTASAINSKQAVISEGVGKIITGIDCVITDDFTTNFYPYTWGNDSTYDYPLNIVYENGTGRYLIDCEDWASNGFRRRADTAGGVFSGNTVNRGYVTITYID